MTNDERMKIAAVVKTLRRVSVSDGDDGNLDKMSACIKELTKMVNSTETTSQSANTTNTTTERSE